MNIDKELFKIKLSGKIADNIMITVPDYDIHGMLYCVYGFMSNNRCRAMRIGIGYMWKQGNWDVYNVLTFPDYIIHDLDNDCVDNILKNCLYNVYKLERPSLTKEKQ